MTADQLKALKELQTGINTIVTEAENEADDTEIVALLGDLESVISDLILELDSETED